MNNASIEFQEQVIIRVPVGMSWRIIELTREQALMARDVLNKTFPADVETGEKA